LPRSTEISIELDSLTERLRLLSVIPESEEIGNLYTFLQSSVEFLEKYSDIDKFNFYLLSEREKKDSINDSVFDLTRT